MSGLCSSAAAGFRALLSTFAVPLSVGLALLALEVAAGVLILDVTGAAGPALLAALGNLAAGLQFGLTLLPGREPLISRFSRHDIAGRPDGVERYTRRLTAIWTLVLIIFALAFLLAAAGHISIIALSRFEPAFLLVLFLGEHVLRGRCFPELGRVTPLRTLRAILLSYRQARHAP